MPASQVGSSPIPFSNNIYSITDITMYETLLRPIDVSHVPTLQPVSIITEKLKQAERKREDKRLKQIATGKKQQQHTKRKRGEADNDVAAEPSAQDQEAHRDRDEVEEGLGAVASKRIKTDDEDERGADHRRRHAEEPEEVAMELDLAPLPSMSMAAIPPIQPLQQTKISVSKALSQVRGHTSYLTFASLQPFPGSGTALVGEDSEEAGVEILSSLAMYL